MEDPSAGQLSSREQQVLELVVTGASNREIAQRLVISVNTVKVHMRNIFEKLEVQSRTEAATKAIQEGWVTVSEPEADAGEAAESQPLAAKTFLLNANPPVALAQWQQIYLLLALLLAILVATLPLLSRNTPVVTSDLIPVIYSQGPKPLPPAPAGGGSQRWIPHPPMPTSRAGLAVVAFDKKIFAIGGVRDNDQATRSVEIFDPLTDKWTEGDSKPTAATNIAGAALGDKIYIPGGCTNEDGQAVDVLEIYAPKTDSWSQGAPLPAARCGYGLAAYQDKLYLFGGWNGETFEDTIFVYTPEADRWEISPRVLPHPLGYLGAAVFDRTIYIAGGIDGATAFNQTYAFSPDTGEWVEKAPLTEKRGGLGLISGAGSLYAIGGGWNDGLSASEKYNPYTDTWTTFETPFASQWRNLGLTTVDTNIYAIGGWDGSQTEVMDSVMSYQFIFQLFIPVSASGQSDKATP